MEKDRIFKHEMVFIDPDHLDGANGVGISQTPAERLVVRAAALRALDVLDAPALTTLDLRGAAQACHIAIRTCPALRVIRLPVLGDGAVLHLDLGTRTTPLSVNGRIDGLDACWADGTSLTVPPADNPYRDAWIGQALAPETRADILVLKPAICDLPDTVTLPPARALHLIGGGGIRSLHIDQRPGQSVAIDGLPDLDQVAGPSSVTRLWVHRTPVLARIDVGGGALKVRNKGASTPLFVDGPWLTGAFHGVRGPITAPLIADVEASDCPDSPAMWPPGTGGDRHLLAHMSDERFSLEQRLATASRWTKAVRGCNALPSALRVLRALEQAGAPHGAILGLHRSLEKSFQRADSRVPRKMAWRWPTDYDLAQEAWDADLDLRLALSKGAFGDAACLAGVRASGHVAQFAALARGLRRYRGPAKEALATWLAAGLQALTEPGADIEAAAHPVSVMSDFSALTRGVSGTLDLPRLDDIRRSLVSVIALWDDEGEVRIPLLRQCVRADFPEARVTLLRLAQAWDRLAPGSAAKARMVALLPGNAAPRRAA